MPKLTPLGIVCVTLLIQNAIDFDAVPDMVKEEVRHYYPLLSGRPVKE